MIRLLLKLSSHFCKLTFNSFVLFTALFATLFSGITAAEATKEQELKAALIYRMGGYVIWKDKPQKLTFCFIGGESHVIGEVLSNKVKIGKLPAHINVVNKDSYTDQTTKDCSVVYITEGFDVSKELVNSISKSVFTITNSNNALKQGFIASIEIHKNKPLLSISKRNLKNSEVSVNSRFLSYVNLM